MDPGLLTAPAAAVTAPERLRFAYRAGDGTETRRLVEPHHLVAANRRWYLVAYDNDREHWRTFRLVLLDADFEVHEPPELIAYLRTLGARVLRAADTPTERGQPTVTER